MITVSIDFFRQIFPRLRIETAPTNNQAIPQALVEDLLSEAIVQFMSLVTSSGYAIVSTTPLQNIHLFICYKVASVLIPQYQNTDTEYLRFINTKYKEYEALAMGDVNRLVQQMPKGGGSVSIPKEALRP